MNTSNDFPSNNPKLIWKEQKMTAHTLTPTQLENRARKLENRIGVRNWFEYIAGGLVGIGGLIVGAWILVDGPSLIETVAGAGFLLLGAGALFACLQLHRRTNIETRIDGAGTTLAHYRAELTRQRDALQSVFRWYIAPFLPGFLLIYGSVFLDPEVEVLWAAIPAVITIAFLVWVLRINRKAADCIDDELRALDKGDGRG